MKYIEKDSAIQFCDKVLGTDTVYSPEVKNAFKAYKAYLEILATVDAVPVVRCGECKHWSQTDTMNGKRFGQCLYPHTVVRSNCFVQESFYCADGERKVQE